MTTVTIKDIQSFLQHAGLDVLKVIHFYSLQVAEEREKIDILEKQEKKIRLAQTEIVNNSLFNNKETVCSIILTFIKWYINTHDKSIRFLRMTTEYYTMNINEAHIRFYIALDFTSADLETVTVVQENGEKQMLHLYKIYSTKKKKIYVCSFWLAQPKKT